MDEIIAKKILELVGGKKNVKNVFHCATRLRFKLHDMKKVNIEHLEKYEHVVAVVKSMGQFQIVIGNNVPFVYRELKKIGEFKDHSNSKNEKIIVKLIDLIASIFTPFLGAMAGAGIIKGILSLLILVNVLNIQDGTYRILYGAADGFFYFLPMFIAITISKKFETNQYVALSIAAALLYPDLVPNILNEKISFMNIPISMTNYSSSVLPIVFAVYVQSILEKILNQKIHKAVRNFLTPMILLVTIVPLTFLIIGPLGMIIGTSMSNFYTFIYNVSPLIAGAFLGSIWQILVMFGVHWTFVPIMFNNLSELGYDTMSPLMLAPILAQSGATLAVLLKTKNDKMKIVSSSSLISSFFGITEPAVYGVTLKLKTPFVYACISGGIGSALIGFFKVKAFSSTIPSFLSLPTYISNDQNINSPVIIAFIGGLIAFVFAFSLTSILGFKEEKNEIDLNRYLNVTSPIIGKKVNLSKIDNAIFANEIIGRGIAIKGNGKVYAPEDGVITTNFKTNHALGLITNEGIEILIHIGVDCVKMNGEGFISHIKSKEVKKGDLLIEYDINLINKNNYDDTVLIFITNTNKYLEVLEIGEENINLNDEIFRFIH